VVHLACEHYIFSGEDAGHVYYQYLGVSVVFLGSQQITEVDEEYEAVAAGFDADRNGGYAGADECLGEDVAFLHHVDNGAAAPVILAYYHDAAGGYNAYFIYFVAGAEDEFFLLI